MTENDRRAFLKKSAAAAAALGIAGCAPADNPIDEADATAQGTGRGTRSDIGSMARAAMHPETLRAIGEAVLPVADLGTAGVERVAAGFAAWLDGFEPTAEMPHAYLNRGLSEIRYGPPDPAPRWAAQIEALRIEAQKRHRAPFRELDPGTRRTLIERQIERNDLGRLPNPGEARHVTIGMLAYFYATPEATDLCYRAAIRRYECRGLDTLGDEPAALAPAAPEPAVTEPTATEPRS